MKATTKATCPQDYNAELERLGYRIKSKLIRDHEFCTDHLADWSVDLTGPNGKTITTEYHTGKAHRKIGQIAIPHRPTLHQWQQSKPTQPKLVDVIHSIVLDADAANQTFEDWCGDCGYDPDSRKALDTYLACQAGALNLRSIGANIPALSDLLANY